MNGSLFLPPDSQKAWLPARLGYRITPECLQTWHEDVVLPLRFQQPSYQERLQRCQSAPEGMAVLLLEGLEAVQHGIGAVEALLLPEPPPALTRSKKRAPSPAAPSFEQERLALLTLGRYLSGGREWLEAAREAFGGTDGEGQVMERLGLTLERLQHRLDGAAGELQRLESLSLELPVLASPARSRKNGKRTAAAVLLAASAAGWLWAGIDGQALLPGVNPYGREALLLLPALPLLAAVLLLLRPASRPEETRRKPVRGGSRGSRPYAGTMPAGTEPLQTGRTEPL